MNIQVDFHGEIIEFPEGTPDAVINEALQAEEAKTEVAKITAKPKVVEQELEDSYIQGRAKIGVGSGFSFLEAVGETAYDTLTKGYGGQTWTEFGAEFSKNFEENQREQIDFLADTFGWDKPDLELLPKDELERALGMGAEMATDPLMVLGKAKTLTELGTKAAVRAGEWFGIGTGASLAGSGAAKLEEIATGEDTGLARAGATLLSTITAAKTVGPAFVKLEDKANSIAQNMRLLKGGIKTNIDSASKAFAYANTKSILKEVSKAENMDLETIMKDFKQISHYFDDVDVPFFVTMADNPVVKGQLNKLIRNNPSVRARAEKELGLIIDAIENKSNFLFGTPVSGKEFAKEIPTSEVRKGLIGRLSKLKTARVNTSDKIDELGASLIPDVSAEQRGRMISNLVSQRKKDAQEIRTLEYAKLLGSAKADKVVMPQEGVAKIWKFVKSTRLNDLFGEGTKIENQISRYLKPKVVTKTINKGVGASLAGKKSQIVKEAIYPKMTFSQVDSLKRAVNKKLRGSLSPEVRNNLEDLKKVIAKARETIPGPYNAALKLADSNYYKNVGIPFTKEGIKEISSKKYASQIAPIIVKDTEQLQHFLDVVPRQQGLTIARNALLSEVYAKAVVGGEVKPALVRNIMKKKRDIIKLIPGMDKELERAAKYQGYLALRKNTIDKVVAEQERKIGEHFLIKAGGVEGYEPTKVVKSMVENRDKLTKIMGDINRLDPKVKTPVINTLRRQFVNHIGDHPEGALKWISNPENKYTLDTIMGKNYQKQVKAFATLSDKLRAIDLEKVANMPTGAVYDWFKQKTNVDLASIVATVRRPIISAFQKGLILASRVWTGGRASKAEKQLETVFFTNLEGIEKFAKLEAKYKHQMDVMSLLKDYTNIAGEILPTFVYGGLKGVVLGEESSQALEEQQKIIINSIKY